MLLANLPKTIWAQVNHNTTDSTNDDDSDVIDPDYKPLTRSGNTVNGKWYGIGNVVTTNQSNSYLCELLLKEDRKGNVTGYFNYFFRDGYFSNKLYGTYDRTTQTFKFKPVIVLFHQTVKANIGVDVPMYGNFIFNLNSKDTTLTGFLMPISNYKYMVPALNIRLSIVPKNEPTLKERIQKKKLDLEGDDDIKTVMNEAKRDAAKNETATKANSKGESKPKTYQNDVARTKDAANKAYQNDIVKSKEVTNRNYQNDAIKSNDNGQVKHFKNDVVKNDTIVNKNKGRDVLTFKDGVKKAYGNDTIRPVSHVKSEKGNDIAKNPVIQRNYQNDNLKFNDQLAAINKAVEEEFTRRTTNTYKAFTVLDDSVTVTLYDNGEFDHDSVSVFFNGKLIASNIELKTNANAATKLVIYLDKTPGAKNELTLFAQNLGTIPPNSALMIVEDTHGTRYEVTLTSDLDHNASILLTPKLK